MNVVNSQYAFTIYTGLNVDFLQLKNSLGQVTGWIDCNGNLGGTLGSTSSSFAQSAQLVIVGNSADDFLHLISGNVVAAWINSSGVWCNSGNPSVRAIKTIVAPTATSDLLVFSSNTLLNPQVVSKVDSFGNYNIQVSSITNLQFSMTDTTVVATWTTAQPTYSLLFVGGKAAIDNGYQMSVTSHQAIVTGLTPSTVYECQVESDGETVVASIVTNPAQTRTSITSVSMGSVLATSSVHGDTIYNFLSNDGITYTTMDDGYGWTSANSGANQQLDKLTNETTLQGSTVNLLTAYGGFATSNGTDGIDGAAATNKASGLFGMNGNLYMFQTRGVYSSTGNQTQWAANVMKSPDHGATWNSWQSPSTYSANGIPPNPLGSYQFGQQTWGWAVPVRYAADDGTFGYNTPGNQIDGANGFVYVTMNDGYWQDSNNLYLARIPRVYFDAQSTTAWQYWAGPTSPTPADFVNDSNWQSSTSGCTAIYSATGKVSAPDMVFVPALNYYLLLTWYFPNSATPSSSVWTILAGPTPAGPWTNVLTQINPLNGAYNPVVMHRTVCTNTELTNIVLSVVYGTAYNIPSVYYYPVNQQMILNPTS